MHRYFATAARGSEAVVAEELRVIGAEDVEPGRAGVSFGGGLEVGYRAALWLRAASRVLLELDRFEARDADQLYAGVENLDWSAHMGPDQTLAIDARGTNRELRDERFVARRVKDAIADQLRAKTGRRPSVDTASPDVRLALKLSSTRATLSLDLAGESLHRRGYRGATGPAPLKESVAAAILMLADWPEIAAHGGSLVDPMCGSGTLLVEAAWIATDRAPGLTRRRWVFSSWKGHDAELWGRVLDEATHRAKAGAEAFAGRITGYDGDGRALRAALGNVEEARVTGCVHVERRAVADAEPRGEGGLVITNPPYGERLGDEITAGAAFDELGAVLAERFGEGWTAAVISGESKLLDRLRLRRTKTFPVMNGGLECELALVDPSAPVASRRRGQPRAVADAPEVDVAPFENRVRKNLRKLKSWLGRTKPEAYRVYDADIPEFNLAVDRYGRWVHVQEYEPPEAVEVKLAQARLDAAVSALPELLKVTPDRVVVKTRRRQRGREQYGRYDRSDEYFEVREGPARLLVNLRDYLDTGLFLDHRPARAWIREHAHEKRFLNLFCYTGTVTVHAALGGAASSTSVDLSQRYLDWARRNLETNRANPRLHELVRADVLDWLDEAAARGRRWTLAFVDPPTFSNSKKMRGTWDIKRDHLVLLEKVAKVMAPGSTTIFSCNRRSFRLGDVTPWFEVEDITEKTMPPDFPRRPPAHRAWQLIRR